MKEFHLSFLSVCMYIFLNGNCVLSQESDDPVYSDCGGDITATRGSITSPGYPDDYDNSLRCTWRISNADDVRIRLTFNDLEVENSRNCQYDYLSITLMNQPDERLCGSQPPNDPLEGSLPASITFSSDGSVGGRGFSMEFQVLSPCLSEPCQNGGTCQDKTDDTFDCSCVEGWEGDLCEIEINECLSNPCQNSGTCEDQVGSFSCACLSGVTGNLCEVVGDHCLHFDPCVNAATCENTNGSYVCRCLSGYSGKNCENDLDECTSDPCQNGGTCLNEVDRYTCSCSQRFSGNHCEIAATTTTLQAAESSNSNLAQIPEEDPCLNIECLNGGSCVVLDGGGSVSCICLDGYEGLRCQNNKTFSSYFIGMLIASCLSALCALILAGIVYYLACKQGSVSDKVESLALQQQDHTKSANHADKQQKLAPHGIDNLHGNDAGYTLPHHVQDNLANSSHGTTLPYYGDTNPLQVY